MATSPQAQEELPSRNSRDGRTSSLVGGFIRRSKSNDILGERKSSGRLRKKLSESEQEEQLRRQKVLNTPPKLPGLPQQEQIQSFGGEDYRPRTSTMSMSDAPPVPPIPAGLGNGTVDPHARTESMTHRGRYSYAQSTTSTLNSPRRVRRRKDPTPYNVLIIGARNSGKTSFLNFLKHSLALPVRKQSQGTAQTDPLPASARSNKTFIHHYQEIEMENERIGLTLWDSPGLDKGVVDLQLREMSNFVESKFDDSFIEEMKVVRAPGLQDTHIHCVFLILDPLRLDSNIKQSQQALDTVKGRANMARGIVGALDEDFDIQVLRTLQGKTTVIPVISKADTVTTAHMAYLKKMVLQGLRRSGLDPLEALNFESEDSDDDDDDYDDKIDEMDEEENEHVGEKTSDAEAGGSAPIKDDEGEATPSTKKAPASNSRKTSSHKREPSAMSISDTLLESGYLPFSLLSPDEYSLDPAQGPVGRKFPWGFADPYNPDHCDFVKLKEACFRHWRAELREASRDVFYERWRTSRLNRNTANGARSNAGPRKSSGGIPITLSPNTRIKRG